MKYSFVLPAYKSRFLKDAIDSILSQSYKDFELIIVNDASPDDIDAIVRYYNDDRIKYYKNTDNLGGKSLVKQWNYSISLTDSEYIILASDDDLYDPRYLESIDKLVERYPQVSVFRPRVQYVDEYNNIIRFDGILKEWNSCLDFWYSWVRGWIGSGIPFYVFKRQSLLNVGGFANYPLAWFSDDSTILRLSREGIVFTPDILFSFRLSTINITSRKNSYKDLLQKINATELFYQEVSRFIKELNVEDEYQSCLSNNIQRKLPKFLQEDKLRMQIFNSSNVTVLRLLPKVLTLSFVSTKLIMRYYLSHFIH